MIRVVRAKAGDTDRRTWTVRSSISWTRPAMADQFETDMAGGYVSGIIMLGILAFLTLFVVFWTPAQVEIPAWFALLILLGLLMLPVLWALQRPWVVTAHTEEPAETGGEYWEGVVRGVVSAREETHRVADELRRWGVPNSGGGPLTRITPADALREP
jgi:hypothetical protein